MKKKNIGSSVDSWLREEGIYEEVTATATRRRHPGNMDHAERVAKRLFEHVVNGARMQYRPVQS